MTDVEMERAHAQDMAKERECVDAAYYLRQLLHAFSGEQAQTLEDAILVLEREAARLVAVWD